jgi:pantoate--beta-alanine ligase
MQTVKDPTALRGYVCSWRRDARRIALVPTMGNLHAGHTALVKRAKQLADRTVVSIFVNPMQFVPGEDYDRYPRTPEQDLQLLSEADVDLVFAPGIDDIYAKGFENSTRVQVPQLDSILCGKSRPGHFTGVATVVTKLFNLTQPDIAVFGDKDYQQLLLIRRVVEDLCFPIDIVAIPTVRDVDGLALSSRNSYLSRAERERAPLLYRTLKDIAEKLKKSQTGFASLETEASATLKSHGFRPDYVVIRRSEDLLPPTSGDTQLVILAAAWLGSTRLIDHEEVRRG